MCIRDRTGNLYALRDKLTALLPAWPVTVVHPLPRRKRLIWVDPESGEATPPRLTPKTGRFTDALDQLYGLLPLIGDPNLTVVLLLVDLDEYRLRDGWSRDGKRGSHRTERFPTAMGDSLALSCRCLLYTSPRAPDKHNASTWSTGRRMLRRAV